jgi:predicted alpha-1,2-mannosidase
MKNKVLTGLLLVLIGGWGNLLAQNAGSNYARQVNTLIGTKGVGLTSGYLYPGATYPYGMVQFTPSYFSKRSGFVINQLSGGGCEHMGNFPTFPVKGKLKMSPDNILNYRINISEEKGHAGYYEAMVQEDIKAKLTVTERTGMASYEYPADQQYGTVIIGGGISATPIEQAAIVITAPNKCEGYAEGGNFCGLRTPYKVYFVAEFDADALESGTWKRDELKPNTTFAEGEYSGVYFTFDVSKKKNVQYKIGVSYVSVENARENLKAENTGWDFLQIQNQAESKWNHYLGKIEVEGTNPDRATQFYTHLYRSFIHPNVCSDVNGEYMGADFRVHKSRSKHYTSFSNWDTYRTQIQLLSMLDPEVASDIVISHQLFAEEAGGAFPRWVMANIETGVMQGDPTPILISNAYAFGARNYDPKPIFKIMRKGAEEPGAMSQDVEARPGLKQYLDKGYYNASIQLEYTSADFAIAQFALHAVGDEFASWRYFHFARSWKNLYNPETGWLQSRNPDGSWKPLTEDFRESTYKNYFWMVPYDIAGLIEIIGGKAVAEKRLDEFFTRLDAGYNDAWFASGNEPSFHIPWIYNWVGTPYKAQEIINRVLNEQYSSKIDGLPGNDDLGTCEVKITPARKLISYGM